MSAGTTLIVARHGNTFAPGEPPRRVGLTDIPLVEKGKAQGAALGAYLREQGFLPDLVVTSTLQRTIETASHALDTLGYHPERRQESLFDEIHYGPDENQPEAVVRERIGEEALRRWEEEAIPPPGWQVDPPALIEGWQVFAARMAASHAGQTVLVITSNGIARFAPYLTGDMAQFRRHYPLKLATGALGILVQADETSERWHCKGWNIRPPLPAPCYT